MSWQEVIFQYDGTLDGFLCCVFDSYSYNEIPVAFCCNEDFISLYEIRAVYTDRSHSLRVAQGIQKRSAYAYGIVRRAFLTCLPDKELYLYAFIKKLLSDGPSFLSNRSDEMLYPLAKAIRHMDGELEKLRGFIRFSDYHGVLGAEIEPKNRVLPLLRHHFCNRYANESFFIFDRTHHEILVYSRSHSRLFPLDHLHLSCPDDTEVQFRILWKRFFQTVSIAERKNPRCQNTFMPKRYRHLMTEFLPVDTGINPSELSQPSKIGAPPNFYALNEKPVPGKPQEDVRSDPA